MLSTWTLRGRTPAALGFAVWGSGELRLQAL